MATQTKTIYAPKPTEVSVAQKQTTGTNIATITVNGTATELYAPNGDSGGETFFPLGIQMGALDVTVSSEQYTSLMNQPVGTTVSNQYLTYSNTVTINDKITVPGIYSKSSSGSIEKCSATIPVVINYLSPDSTPIYYGALSIVWTKSENTDPAYGCVFVVNSMVRSQVDQEDKYLFGKLVFTVSTNTITYDESNYTFTFPDELTFTNCEFTLYNSIESGGSGTASGVSSVDWSGQYTAENGVEIGTLTITTTD